MPRSPSGAISMLVGSLKLGFMFQIVDSNNRKTSGTKSQILTPDFGFYIKLIFGKVETSTRYN
jgi:hypothetical protein